MKTISATILLFAMSLISGTAQDAEKIVFTGVAPKINLNDVDDTGVRKHPLGAEYTKKMVLLQDRYTRVEPASPTSPAPKTKILKPIVYNSVKKVNKHFVKGLKKKMVTEEIARESIALCLDIALKVYSKNTSILESKIRAAKTAEDIVAVYEQVVLEEY